jgi:hemoglobin/transferrin/lactoferrin receptor protein
MSLNADFQALRGKNEIRYGAEGSYNVVSSTAEAINVETGVKSPASTRYPADGSNMFFGGVYTTVNREFKKRWVANLGVRASIVTLNARFGDSALTGFAFTGATQRNMGVNYQAGLVYNDSLGFRIAARIGSGFRAPNIDDMGKVFDSDPKLKQVIVPNKDLKPEYTNTFELSVGKSVGRRINVEATGWYTLYNSAIVLRPYTFNGQDSIVYDGINSRAYANQNAASAYLYGASLNFRWRFFRGFSVTGTATYTYGRINTDSADYPLDHIPPVYGRAGVRWNNNRIDAEFFALFNGAKRVKDYNMTGEDNYFDGTVNGMPAWYTLNVRAAYRLNPFTTIQVAAENLLDQNYRVFASGISAPGLNFTVTVRVQL